MLRSLRRLLRTVAADGGELLGGQADRLLLALRTGKAAGLKARREAADIANAQAVGGRTQLEAQSTTLSEVAIHKRSQSYRHDSLPAAAAAEVPGQGKATSTRRLLSSLA